MSLQGIQKNFPGLLHTPAKYDKNPPYGCEAIAKRKCGSNGVASPIYKRRLIKNFLHNFWEKSPNDSADTLVIKHFPEIAQSRTVQRKKYVFAFYVEIQDGCQKRLL